MEDLRPILGRTLVLVAHPDDEAAGCGALVQRIADPIVIYATDGAPRSDFFWKQHGSREAYAAIRRREAEQALAAAGVAHSHFLDEANPVPDQELFLNIECAFMALTRLIGCELPEAILSLAYEGGHPDHDSCAFLAAMAGQHFGLPVWEMPLYHRGDNNIVRGAFLDGEAVHVQPTNDELARKRAMFAAYQSQAHVMAEFAPERESVRPMRDYDFSRPPHEGALNYEAWQWPMQGNDLCRAFTTFSNKSLILGKCTWGTAA